MLATTILGVTMSAVWFLLILFVWILIALWPATIARSKGHSFFGWFLLSLFFWWITLFVVLFLPNRNRPAPVAAPTTEQ
jgi:hypothetical protein